MVPKFIIVEGVRILMIETGSVKTCIGPPGNMFTFCHASHALACACNVWHKKKKDIFISLNFILIITTVHYSFDTVRHIDSASVI